MRVIDLNRHDSGQPGQRVTRQFLPVPVFVKVRDAACQTCQHQRIQAWAERCALAPDWTCLGKIRKNPAMECPAGRWTKELQEVS